MRPRRSGGDRLPRPWTRSVLLLWAPALGLACSTGGRAEDARVVVAGHTFTCEVAATPGARMTGLSGRSPLPADRCLLFVFERAARHGFWMKDMHFAIDIVWVEDGRIVHVVSGAPPSRDAAPPVYRPPSPARYVFEVTAGAAASAGWRPGTPVMIELPSATEGPGADHPQGDPPRKPRKPAE